MNHDDEIKLSRDEYAFRMHMVEFSSRTDEALKTLKKGTSEQWHEINELKKAPRRMTAIASSISTAVAGVVIAILEMFRGR